MAGDVTTILISSGVSLISAFGSIILKDHLDQRRETRKLAPTAPPARPGAATAPVPGTTATVESPLGAAVDRYSTIDRSAPMPQSRAGRGRSWRLALAIIAFGIGMGVFEPGMHGDLGIAMLIGMLAAGVALLVYYIRPSARSAFGYQLGVLSLWGAFFAAATASRGYLREDTVSIFAALWGAFAVIGLVAFGLTYRWGRRR